MKTISMSRYLCYFSLLVSWIFLTGCEEEPAASKKPRNKTHLVEYIKISPQTTTVSRRFNASIVAPNTINISSQVAGTILQLPHYPGTRVKRGDTLVKIDDQLFLAEYEKATASLDKAKSDLKRTQKLLPRKLASEEELSSAITNHQLAKAELKLKEIQLNRSTISSPFDGIISERHFEPGDSITTNTHILSLIDDSFFIIRSSVPESYLSFLIKDTDVEVYIPSINKTLNAKISTIYPSVDQTTQQVRIEAVFSDHKSRLFSGQFAEIIIKQKFDDAILVPANAIQYDKNKTWVYSVQKNKASKTTVKAGINIGNSLLIHSGLQAGDIVITKGFVGLKPGKKITNTATATKIK